MHDAIKSFPIFHLVNLFDFKSVCLCYNYKQGCLINIYLSMYMYQCKRAGAGIQAFLTDQ